MKIVFFGTPEPAAEVLAPLLASGHEIVAIVTQPDRPKGRGMKVAFSPVKELAVKHSLPVEQPEKVKNDPGFLSWLKSLEPDIAVVVAYGKILPKEILDIPKYGFINLHASLLPKYRGAAPVQWALLKGEKETGLTIFKLAEQLDAGPVISQQKISIGEEDDTITLLDKIFMTAPSLLLKTLQQIEDGSAKYIVQDEAAVSFAPLIGKESGEIDWKKGAQEVHDRVRALVLWPGAHTIFHGKRLKLLKTRLGALDLGHEPRLPGTVLQTLKNDGFIVATGRGDLLVLEVQLEGGRRMKASEFIIGHDVRINETLPN